MSAERLFARLGRARGVTILLALVAVVSARADTLRVPSEYPTIQSAIDAAQDGDEVLVASGRYEEVIDLLGKELWLHSEEGAASTTIDARGLDASVITCAGGEPPATLIEGFTISGGMGTPMVNGTSGAGAYIVDASPSFRNCIFTDNFATLYGGAVFHDGGEPTFVDCEFSNNRALMSSGRELSGARGGAIYSGAGDLFIDRCRFDSNRTNYSGGAISKRDDSIVLRGSEFVDNQALGYRGDQSDPPGFGGAISAADHTEISNCYFARNIARAIGIGLPAGGAIISSGELVISESIFEGNIAHSGGAISLSRGEVDVIACQFLRNDALGAALDVGDSIRAHVSDSEVAENNGTAIHVEDSALTLDSCLVVGNEGFRGGAMRSRDAELQIIDTRFQDNSSERGGILLESSFALFERSVFLENDGVNAGAVLATGGASRWSQCLFVQNASDSYGGVIVADGGAHLFHNCLFAANKALNGAVVATNVQSDPMPDTVEIVNSIIWNGLDWYWYERDDEIAVSYCNVQNGYAGHGNISTDPRFVDPSRLDFHLQPDSPCIDAGDTYAVTPFTPFDLDQNPRFVGAFVDIGPYERQDVESELTLRAPAPGIAGTSNTLDVGGATPGGDVTALWALGQGATPIPQCPGLQLDLRRPTRLDTVRADRYGFARFSADVPAEAQDLRIFLQAVDHDSCAVSNLVDVRF